MVAGSSALGCFVVVHCNKSTSDCYYALPRNGDTVSDMIHVPLATSYTIVVYDLAQKGLPNQLPVIEYGQVNVIDPSKSTIYSTCACKCKPHF